MLLELESPGDVVQLHIDNMMTIAFIRRLGGICSQLPCKESHQLWQEAIRRNITILLPQWLSTMDITEADFLSRHRLQRWDLKIVPSEFWRICHRHQFWPTLESFMSKGSHQIPRYISWEIDSRAKVMNALDQYWDPETLLFLLVSFIPLALKGVPQ